MDDYMSYNNFYQQSIPGPEMYASPPIGMDDSMGMQPKANEPPPPPPIVICPTEVDHINVTLEKNQQCECKDCGKLFNSVWYLKQHAVKHSNDRPFKCKFCNKTYKFRSNLYQHKCPERQKSMQQRRRGGLINSAKRNENQIIKTSKIETAIKQEEPQINYQMALQNCFSETEDNDSPITYGLVIQNIDQSQMQMPPPQMGMPPQHPLQQQDLQQQQPPLAHMQNFQNFQMQLPPTVEPLMNDMENSFDKQSDFNSLFSCRKCRVFLPTEEAFLRHSASHNGEDLFPYKCVNCRQAFDNEKELMRHTQTHIESGVFRCFECCGQFKSQVALRRHKDQCRPCFVQPNQTNIMVSVNSPFDPFAYPDDNNLFLPVCDELARGTDSGVGSEGSPNSMSQASPERNGMDDSFSFVNGKKKEKEDDEDSGFRSRLNSVTHSCSPDSFSDSHCDSPPRKLSGGGGGLGASSFLGGYGTGPAYGQQMIYDKSLDDIECDNFGMISDAPSIYNEQRFSLRNVEVQGHEIAVAPIVQYHLQPMSMKEFCITSGTSTADVDTGDIFDYDNRSWKNDGYDMPPMETSEIKELAAVLMTLYLCKAADQCADILSTLAELSIH